MTEKCFVCGKPAVVISSLPSEEDKGYCWEHRGGMPDGGSQTKYAIHKIKEYARREGLPVRFGGEVPDEE